jgi:hypothetical protein
MKCSILNALKIDTNFIILLYILYIYINYLKNKFFKKINGGFNI